MTDMDDQPPVPAPRPAPRNPNLRPPWKPGASGNPAGFRAGYGEVVKLARAHTVEAVRRLAELMRSSDERVSAVACQTLLDRGWGRPRPSDDIAYASDLRSLPDEELDARLGEVLNDLLRRANSKAANEDQTNRDY